MSIVPERDPLLRSPSPDIEAGITATTTRRTAQTQTYELKRQSYDDVETASTSSSNAYPSAAIPTRKPSFSSTSNTSNNYASQRLSIRLRHWIADNYGLVLIAAAQLLYSTMAALFKLLNDLPAPKPGAMEVICIRMSITYAGCLVYMFAAATPHPILGPPDVRHLLALRGFVGFGGVAGLYVSLQYLTLSDATVITFLSPIATSFLAYLTLNEPFSMRETIAGVASLGGVVLIARPTFVFGSLADAEAVIPVAAEAVADARLATRSLLQLRDAVAGPAASSVVNHVTEEQRLWAVGIALCGALCAAGAYTSIRAIGKRASAAHTVAAFSLYATVVSALVMWYNSEPFVMPRSASWCIALILIGICGLGAQILAAMGLQRERAGRATILVYSQVIYSSLFQWMMGGKFAPLSALGCIVILVSAAWVTVSKR